MREREREKEKERERQTVAVASSVAAGAVFVSGIVSILRPTVSYSSYETGFIRSQSCLSLVFLPAHLPSTPSLFI